MRETSVISAPSSGRARNGSKARRASTAGGSITTGFGRVNSQIPSDNKTSTTAPPTINSQPFCSQKVGSSSPCSGSKGGIFSSDAKAERQKAPSTNIQAPEKHQHPSSQKTTVADDPRWMFGDWNLELLWSLKLGIWSFAFTLASCHAGSRRIFATQARMV